MTDTEKITINMSVVDLGQVDLLIDEGYYSNRTDFIRTAIRRQLEEHKEALNQTITRKSLVVGVNALTRKSLEDKRKKGVLLDVRVVGMAIIDKDVSPELALETINSIKVNGKFQASKEVKKALESAGRILR